MPVMLKREDEDAWLDPGSSEPTLLSLLAPYDAAKTTLYRVDARVNSVKNDDPQCLEKLEEFGPFAWHGAALIWCAREGVSMAINIIDPNAPGQAHVDSYWASTAGPEIADATPVAGDMEVDIAIVGGGYTGLSTALHLGRKFGLKSHVLEANRIGWGCSGRNGGFATLGIGKTSMAGWIKRWGEAEARRIFDQSGDAVRLVRRLLSEEAIDADATPDGNLELAHLPNRMRELEHDQRFLDSKFGVKSRLVDKAELESKYLISREAHGALLFETGFALHAMKYVRGLARAAQRAGAVLHDSSPVQSWARDGKHHVLTTPRGKVRARQVVIAGNGYTGDRLHPAIEGRLLPALVQHRGDPAADGCGAHGAQLDHHAADQR